MSRSRSGVLPVDKPVGPTSHDAVAMARRALRTRRIGHTGTLDPFASGLLLLCVGPATRLAEYLAELPKTYEATMRLGAETVTGDHTGERVGGSQAWRDLTRDRVDAALRAQVGRIHQVPPAYSAKKVAGERAYARARRGEAVDLEPVEVDVFRIDLLDVRLPDVRFEVECSSGTYIRAIARDAGAALDVGAHLVELRRTRIGRHDVAGAVPLDRLTDPAAVRRAWLEPLEAVAHLPRVDIDDETARALRDGREVRWSGADLPPNVAIAVAYHDDLLAVATFEAETLRPKKVFQ